MHRHERQFIQGPNGRIEVFVEAYPDAQGMALVAHPHPLFGGTADNKVVTTLARAFRDLGCHTFRPNFRGVGESEGCHDRGHGETDDLLAVLDQAQARWGRDLPVYLAGFSFGAYVVTRLAQRLAAAGQPARWLVLAGTAAGAVGDGRFYQPEAVPPETLLIHGAQDDTVPLGQVLDWAEPLELPVYVIPGADHFFHRKLPLIRRLVHSAFKP